MKPVNLLYYNFHYVCFKIKLWSALIKFDFFFRPLEKSNPVLELQSRGKQYQSDYADEDDPPYNFQVIYFIETFLQQIYNY